MPGRILIFGAGASGRGHVGQLAFESGHEVVFVDKDRDLVDRLRKAGRYTVRLVSAQPRDFVVDRFRTFHLDEREEIFQAFLESSLVFTVVCPNNLRDVAEYIRPMVIAWLQAGGREAKDLLACENMNQGSTTFRRFLLDGFPGGDAGAELARSLDARMGFADTMIARVVAKPKDPLRLLGEEYSEWTADRKALRGAVPPQIRTLDLVDDQGRYLQRKLYIHNTGHAMFGYLGFLKGYEYIHEAARDPAILQAAEKAIEESGWAIQHEHGFPEDVIRAYRKALIDKCPCEALPDEVVRVVREPIRKLGPEERFFGPAALLLKHGREPRVLLHGPCAAMLARIPGDPESERMGRLLEDGGVRGVLAAIGVRMPDPVVRTMEDLLPVLRESLGRRR